MAITKFPTSKNWYSRFTIEGKLYQRTTRTPDKKLAQRLDEQWYKETLENLASLSDKDITIADALEKYAKTDQNRDFQKNCTFYPDWLTKNKIDTKQLLTALDTKFFQRIVQIRKDEGRSASTTNHTVIFFNLFLKWAKANGYKVAQYETTKLKVKNTRLVYLKPAQELELLTYLDPKKTRNGLAKIEDMSEQMMDERIDNYHLCLLLLDTGARLNEICSLEWRHVNMVQGFIELFREKVGNESIIHLTDRCRKVINERFLERGRSRYVFPARKVKNARRTCVGALRKAIKKVCGTEFTIHSLRHTCATRLAQAGMNMYELQNQLGHAGPAMTQKYAHLAVADVSKKARDMLNKKV